MTITSIKQQVKQASRYSIFVDGVYSFSLGDAALLDSKLYVGQELESDRIKELKQLSSDDKIYGLVLRYVAMRPRSIWEIKTYLERKKCSPLLAEQILNKLSINGLIDDLAFAQSWVRSRSLLKPSSRRKIFQELLAKHVSEVVISQALDENIESDTEALHALIAKKRSRYSDDLKLMQYLARQGFGYDDIKRALKGPDNEY